MPPSPAFAPLIGASRHLRTGHSEGRKLDIASYYADAAGSYLPGTLRFPIGYWAFEQPAAVPVRVWLSLRWNMAALQGMFPERLLEPERTRAALRWLVTEGQRFGIERGFVEPYLVARLDVSSAILGFQGCRAARHDDHIHVQLKR